MRTWYYPEFRKWHVAILRAGHVDRAVDAAPALQLFVGRVHNGVAFDFGNVAGDDLKCRR